MIASVGRSQGLNRQDSIKSFDVFVTPELQDNSKLLDELEYRRAKDSIDNKIIDSLIQNANDYKMLYNGAKNIIDINDEQKEILKAQVEAVRPAWYDNFITGSAVTAVVLAVIFLIIPK